MNKMAGIRNELTALLPLFIFHDGENFQINFFSKSFAYTSRGIKIDITTVMKYIKAGLFGHTEQELELQFKIVKANLIKSEYEEIKTKYLDYSNFMLKNPELFF